MNYLRLALAALGGTVVYFVIGFATFGLIPSLRDEFLKYGTVYRTQDEMKTVMPVGMIGILLSIFVLAVLYSMIYKGGPGLTEGLRFGVLIGLFAIGAFVLHNYINLRIGLTLTVQQSVAYFVEWVAVGVTIGLIYKP
jgi:hypothetical protein